MKKSLHFLITCTNKCKVIVKEWNEKVRNNFKRYKYCTWKYRAFLCKNKQVLYSTCSKYKFFKAEEDFVQYSTVQKSEQSRAHMYEYQGIVLKHVGRFSLQSYHSKNKVKCVQYMGVKGEKRGFFVDNMEGYWAGTFYMLHVKVLRRTRNMFWSACYMICDAYYMLHATRCMLRVTLYMFHVTCYMLHATCYMLLHGTPYMMDVTCYMLQYMCLQT